MDNMGDEPDLLIDQLDSSLKQNEPVQINNGAAQENDADIQNVFEYQDFIDRHEPQHEKMTEEALQVIALQNLNDEDLDSRNPGEQNGAGQRSVELGQSYSNGANGTEESASKSGEIVHVEYLPNGKTKRLGRPRKHMNGMPVPDLDELSLVNLEKATLSKFRLDELPVEGPGSRGGDPLLQRKTKGKLTESPALKKRKQAILNFTKSEDSASLGLATGGDDQNQKLEVKNEKVNDKMDVDLEKQEKSSGDSRIGESEETTGYSGSAKLNLDGLSPSVKEEAGLEILGTPETGNTTESGIETGLENGTETGNTTETGIIIEPAERAGDAEIAGKSENSESLASGEAENGSVKREVEASTETPRKRTRLRRETPKKKEAAKKKETKPKETTYKKLTLNFKPKTSRTTIIREKNRVTRTYPGPLLPVHFDLYDDNILDAKTNEQITLEKLALGFPTKKCDYLSDILMIIQYLLKFEHIVDFGPIGPQDLEEGLGLLEENTLVLPAMEQLFRKLLALVLNRKKPILLSMQRTAIQELKGQYIGLGLPQEWRDDTHIRLITSLPCDPEKDRVDLTKPAVTSADNIEYQAPMEKMNPFLEKDFEEFGLAGIENPMDRLIMLRCLVVWSLSALNQLKTYLTKVINGQDIPGERDTLYASRAVLKGFTHTLELKKELELKLSKKSKGTQTPKGTPDPDSITRYIDPTSDPLVHPMKLRFNEFLVGDCGFHIGRFYLVRMADSSGGAISSVEKMKHVAKDAAGVRLLIPSSFKLYVEDVHETLTNALPVYGPEFDEKGKELAPATSAVPELWHVVASTADELAAFVAHVGARLGLAKSDQPAISTGSLAYKPLLHMHQYLKMLVPLLAEFEKLEVTGVGEVRQLRKRKIDYSNKVEYDEEEYHEDEYAHAEEGDDDDYFEDGE